MARTKSECTPAMLWQYESYSYAAIAIVVGIKSVTVSTRARQFGFRRAGTRGQHFTEGPCLNCMNPFDAAQLNTDHLCSVCAPAATAPLPPSRTITDPELRKWYEEAADQVCANRGVERGALIGHAYDPMADPLLTGHSGSRRTLRLAVS